MLSHIVQEVVARYKREEGGEAPPESVPRIHIDEVASQVAVFYEKVRNVVDYKEEHLLRRRFIDRVIRRRLFLSANGNVAESIVKEIIRAGYLPNDAVPETKIAEVGEIVRNNKAIAEHLPKGARQKEAHEWLFTMTASAIEENLFPPRKEDALSSLMFLSLKEHLVVRGKEVPEETSRIELFIAVLKTLMKADEEQIHYALLKFMYPNWARMTEDEAVAFAGELRAVKKKIQSLIDDPLAPYFYKLCNHYAIVFHLVGDLMDRAVNYDDFAAMAGDPVRLEEAVRDAYDDRFRAMRKRLNRLGFLSVLSFFLSKILVVLAIEIPIERGLTHDFSAVNTAVNILFPPFLMLLIAFAIKMPKRRNFDLVFEAIDGVLFGAAERPYIVEVPKRRGLAADIAVNVFYVAVFVFVFYFCSKLLLPLGFNVANIVVLLLFVSVVAAAGVRIHNRARELDLEKPRTNFFTFIFDLFSMPFIAVGKWIIAGLAKFNPIVVLINLLIELPFQLFVEFLENFNGFLKSKREEIT